MKKENKQNNDDVVIEMDSDLDDSVLGDENLNDLVKKLRTQLKEEKKKSADNLIGWQKSQADFVNFRKREEKERVEFIKFANEKLILEILDVLDSFDRAFVNEGNLDENTQKGVFLIHKQLVKMLEKNGVKEDNPIGQNFDPNKHMAVQNVKIENKKDEDKIIEVMQKGYILGEKVIRPAQVKVGTMD